MKKILTSLMAVMFVLLVVSPAAFASDMKLYHNDNDHCSILVPSDFEYQDVNNIADPKLDGLSLLSISKSTSRMNYTQKVQQEFLRPIEDWPHELIKKWVQDNSNNNLFQNTTFKGSGEIYINNHKLLWVKFSDSNRIMINYIIIHNNSPYSILYICPISTYEKNLPKITESINSLNFDNIAPNWYWLKSDDSSDVYIDINNVSSYKDIATNTVCKRVTLKRVTPEDPIEYYSKNIIEFKKENDVYYYKLMVTDLYDANDKIIFQGDYSPIKSRSWTKLTIINDYASKVIALLFDS
ncbi:hypothetical protein [Anaerosinus massiliensis]|uniref:hypothetical protein n=1 Tax=Massilibacillus massiliensis TaxID=1806837 RepID=UPI000DA63F6A|nr:hypothetical protein [Massilibacillus massiliensis]